MSAHRVPATTGDLIEFVLKRLAEDHLAADAAMTRLVARGLGHYPTDGTWWATTSRGDDPVVAVDPRRALDDVAARRKLALLARTQIEHCRSIAVANAWRDAVRTLALGYKTHPDYRPEWAPTS